MPESIICLANSNSALAATQSMKMAADRGFAPRLNLIQSQGDYYCRVGSWSPATELRRACLITSEDRALARGEMAEGIGNAPNGS